MKPAPIQQEILLVLNTTLSSKQWNEKDATGTKGQASSDKMEEACWNGLLDELLPELIEKSPSGRRLFLWQIRLHEAIIDMELSEFPGTIEKRLSIDPHFSSNDLLLLTIVALLIPSYTHQTLKM